MYQPSRCLETFCIAGFQHYDGATALEAIKPGCLLQMEAEPDNPFDPAAVKLSFDGVKLGYIPHDKNNFTSLAIFYGHRSIFECRVTQVDPQAEPWNQVRVSLFIVDNRTQ